MKSKIRKMLMEDVERVFEIEKSSFSKPWSIEAFKSELAGNKLATYIVIEENAYIVGYIGVWEILEEGHITNIAIDPSYRGKGYAKELIEELIKLLSIKGINKITLEVRVTNFPAIKLYEGFGFKAHGIRKKYYENKEDALIMWFNREEKNER